MRKGMRSVRAVIQYRHMPHTMAARLRSNSRRARPATMLLAKSLDMMKTQVEISRRNLGSDKAAKNICRCQLPRTPGKFQDFMENGSPMFSYFPLAKPSAHRSHLLVEALHAAGVNPRWMAAEALGQIMSQGVRIFQMKHGKLRWRNVYEAVPFG